MQRRKRLVVIGLDGVPFDLIKDLGEKGVTPTAREKFFNYTWGLRQDVFMFVFTETDRLFHFLWAAYEGAFMITNFKIDISDSSSVIDAGRIIKKEVFDL